MNHLTNIVKKEVRELLTPGSVASVIIMVILFASLGGLIGGEVEKASGLPVLGIAGYEDNTVVLEDGTEWNAYIELRDAYINAGVPASDVGQYLRTVVIGDRDLYDVMKEYEISSLIVLDQDFAKNIEHNMQPDTTALDLRKAVIYEYYLYEPTGMFGSVSSTTVNSLVDALNNNLSSLLIKKSIDNPSIYSFLANPITHGGHNMKTIVNGVPHDGVTPQAIASEVSTSTMMVPIIIMIIIMMVGSIVISSMGSEKENKTLETLLTLPIKRTSIVTGKIVAAAIVGLIYGLAYMFGMRFYMGSMTKSMSSGVDLEELGLSLGYGDYAILSLSMFLAIVCALGICMILGAFAKNYKSAQTMTMPLSILAMIPMFVIMFSGWYGSASIIQGLVFAIPFSHPMMAVQALMYDDLTLVLSGMVYMVVFAVITILITVRLYGSDILITGLGQNKTVQKLTRK
jgi:ABC-2 type transport system permease protein